MFNAVHVGNMFPSININYAFSNCIQRVLDVFRCWRCVHNDTERYSSSLINPRGVVPVRPPVWLLIHAAAA